MDERVPSRAMADNVELICDYLLQKSQYGYTSEARSRESFNCVYATRKQQKLRDALSRPHARAAALSFSRGANCSGSPTYVENWTAKTRRTCAAQRMKQNGVKEEKKTCLGQTIGRAKSRNVARKTKGGRHKNNGVGVRWVSKQNTTHHSHLLHYHFLCFLPQPLLRTDPAISPTSNLQSPASRGQTVPLGFHRVFRALALLIRA